MKRVRRISKWATAIAAGLWLSAFLITTIWQPVYWEGNVGVVGMGDGMFIAGRYSLQRGLGWHTVPPSNTELWMFDYRPGPSAALSISGWAPGVGLAALSSLLFWLDRRRPLPGQCRCGYDMTGLAAGAACPECGR